MQISILQGSASGPAVYTETQTPGTNANGLVSIEIGTGTTSDNFSAIDWSNGPFFIKTETDLKGGANYTITGTSQLLSVPYALHAKTAEFVSFTNGIYLPHSFIPDTSFIGSQGNSISFGHQWVSEDFIGYKSNKFYFKDSPGGLDETDPDVIVGGKIGIGVEEPNEKLEIDGNIDIHNHTLKNLSNPVNLQDAATKAYIDASGNILVDAWEALRLNVLQTNQRVKALEESAVLYKGLTDIDNNHYNVIQIGNQIWMAENLLATKYNDDTIIANIRYTTSWGNLSTGAYCWYNNAASFESTYGSLYNWYALNTGKLCPIGWHVPSDEEWTTLTAFLGGESVAGGKMKEIGTTLWQSPNTGATNSSGFSALPGGNRYGSGTFNLIEGNGLWWSATEYSATAAWSRVLYFDFTEVARSYGDKGSGFSVRCVRD